MYEYILMMGALFLLNAQPVLNMPTWIVLSFFSITYDLPVFLITLLGVTAASIGRYVLAIYSGKLTDKYLPKKQKLNLSYISDFVGSRTNPIEIFAVSFLYGLSPLPTNTLFIVAGAAHMRMPLIIGGFFAGEFLSNFVYVEAVRITLNPAHFLIMGILGIIIAIAVLFIDWKKVIHWLLERERKRMAESGVREIFKD
ncbi:MAG: hypothetical protein QW112_00340 [Candidatus Micrarchaeia archaeon]